MSELLFEILSEELPARMLDAAAEQLMQKFIKYCYAAKITAEECKTFHTPRRLTLYVKNISYISNSSQIIKGPRIDAPQIAIEGFAKKNQCQIVELKIESTDKGEFYFYYPSAGKSSIDLLLTNIINEIIANFQWPKTMRWHQHNQSWIRPVRNIMCIFDGKVLPIKAFEMNANRTTKGHRFLSKNLDLAIRDYNNYHQLLYENKVIIEAQQRRQIITEQITKKIEPLGLNFKNDEKLLSEVVGLVEWPHILLAEFNKEFLSIPAEIIELTIKTHQKYFPLYKDNQLTNKFIIVSNIQSDETVIKGNQNVVNARLADALFFYEYDLEHKLINNYNKLHDITLQQELGTVADKCERITNIAIFLSPWIKFLNIEDIPLTAKLIKSDLTTKIVEEFPELQGKIGKEYALKQGIKEEIAQAIAEHYLPINQEDKTPNSPLSIAMALADRLDNLVGFFAVGLKPTSSKDPFALRRAAVGLIKIIQENHINLPLNLILNYCYNQFDNKQINTQQINYTKHHEQILEELTSFINNRFIHYNKPHFNHQIIESIIENQLEEFNIYLNYQLMNKLKSYDIDKLKNITNSFQRIHNILKIEKISYKKNKIDTKQLFEEAEIKLSELYKEYIKQLDKLVENHNIEEIFKILESLVEPIDNFFENVMVNIDDIKVKQNRISLLTNINLLSYRLINWDKLSITRD
jgi:glycyl-tRNA synthetase beta chain